MAHTPAQSPSGCLVMGLFVVAALVAACAASPRRADFDGAVALLRSAEPAARYEAVVQLGMLPPTQARRDALAGAIRDVDDVVRLMAAIVIVGDGPTPYTGPPPAPQATRVLPSRTPNPSWPFPLSPAEQLVAVDPWFAGTLLPGALVAAQDGDWRVRALGQRAIEQFEELEGEGPLDGSALHRGWRER